MSIVNGCRRGFPGGAERLTAAPAGRSNREIDDRLVGELELSTIDAYYQGHKDVKGMFAVDAGSTQGVAQTIKKNGLKDKVKGGGYDLLPPIQQLLADGQIQFTIDQQPYLQGFLPVLQLYMYKVSAGLSGIADVNTGLKFLDKTTVGPYNSTKSRYEGTASSAGVA